MPAAETGEVRHAYIGLGSNIGNREEYLHQALIQLHQHPSIEVVRCSHIYETEPVGYVDQASFLNMAAELRTVLSAEQLLQEMMNTEKRLGRTRDIRWGPRTLDLDMLLYADSELNLPGLTIPHPRMRERAFVMIPLKDIYGKDTLPGGEFVDEILEKLGGKEEVALWKKISWLSEFELFAN
ncbi:2-amino-4-hydroxy-6-hydroxymethyldihydropteridine diphosphokinase [Ferviditalea candida]|uniref:2-amino-4-hydroxy-6-hydroxymethyldihydropteridine diphosphokinase n=1 Tax=Ferviditalea candida TaxID=3108399 RepID=A0ABU5ZL80_9BACL|nr:2-amino-4-hydroxy-6-hydroxymethyldihydropteridine diphosphokinase [Paenibacillaceae bacterium T2]